jgi:hypothetical protein
VAGKNRDMSEEAMKKLNEHIKETKNKLYGEAENGG